MYRIVNQDLGQLLGTTAPNDQPPFDKPSHFDGFS